MSYLPRHIVWRSLGLSLIIAGGCFGIACEAPPRDNERAANAVSTASPSSTATPASPNAENASPSPTENFSVDFSSTPSNIPTPVPATQTSPTPLAGDNLKPTAPADSNSPLLIPVAGVRFENLQNTFKDSRSEGRIHDAIDIIAPRGTPVIACTDGRIVKLFQSVRGGITLYQLSEDEKTVYYYAHLDRYADGITEGKFVRRGELLAYVGDTGNSTPGNYHLHFSVARISSPRDIHNGTYLNPYDLFKPR
jgi:murein DD-endopeptidase MepM/ murein hydrolase activator NlpD